MTIKTAHLATQDPSYHQALTELLYQLADDDFIHSYRGSEWLGLAPHIEEDVAFSSINQDTMGHAAIYYQLLEELGEGNADFLAHARTGPQRRNATILELANGTGTYLEEPRYDWAFTVVRHYFYDLYKKTKLESLKNSSYEPLAQAAVKINTEQFYHLMHWSTWFKQLTTADGEPRQRMIASIQRVWKELGGLLTLGSFEREMVSHRLIENEVLLQERFLSKMGSIFESLGLRIPGPIGMESGNGRIGEHTADLAEALATLSEVYNMDQKAVW
ncbi:1,2-phenylacetyl-CoA epoxidase subunit PaaC [Peribacillus sp. SCS-155]|uniref:1,2-phenylacetyl-CoA epoxidase subunit PaaC n=1 Tax=Peribacillus sedimenti TaxID=3115297 RepID=UPI003906C8BF